MAGIMLFAFSFNIFWAIWSKKIKLGMIIFDLAFFALVVLLVLIRPPFPVVMVVCFSVLAAFMYLVHSRDKFAFFEDLQVFDAKITKSLKGFGRAAALTGFVSIGMGPKAKMKKQGYESKGEELLDLIYDAQYAKATKLIDRIPLARRAELFASTMSYCKEYEFPEDALEDWKHYYVVLLWAQYNISQALFYKSHATALNTACSQRFYDYLKDAQADLQAMIKQSPDIAEAYPLMLQVVKAGYYSLPNVMDPLDIYKAYMKFSPEDLNFRVQMIQCLSPRCSGGSAQSMMTIAQQSLEEAEISKNDYLSCLIVVAHFENWLYEYEQAGAIEDMEDSLADYFLNTSHNDDVKFSFRQFLSAKPEMKVHESQVALNYFAMALYYAECDKAADRAFKLLKGRYYDEPWNMLKLGFKSQVDVRFTIDSIKSSLKYRVSHLDG
ncbi:MAG: hypothetical protein CMD81_02010 [Gammaproteobacteria bacterium]|nr:hypothetical protein [Gammaproteobacteria bacterium]HBF09571.1 hypothetical protein [Gammaproteobacteria bacterium]|tara:strand:+ start:16947 stop:18260 length:1314 start_codon:yes stop_codon:yes gene_type:complete